MANQDEWTEEELLVYVDYGKFVPSSEIIDPDMQLKIIGLDQEKVYSEVNGKVFAGTYDDTFGTYLLFAEDPNMQKTENIFDRTADKPYTLQGSTSKLLKMSRIFIAPKEGVVADEKEATDAADSRVDKYTIDLTYQEALDTLLKPGQVAPRTVTDVLDNKIKLQRELTMEPDL